MIQRGCARRGVVSGIEQKCFTVLYHIQYMPGEFEIKNRYNKTSFISFFFFEKLLITKVNKNYLSKKLLAFICFLFRKRINNRSFCLEFSISLSFLKIFYYYVLIISRLIFFLIYLSHAEFQPFG